MTAEDPVAGGEAVRIEGLHKSFGANEVLKGIDLTVDTHEVVCLIGASGSGKSTLLRCVNLLEPIDAGQISLWGQEITGPGIDPNLVRKQVGIVFQSFNLFPHMTVLRNVTLGPAKVRRVRAAEAGLLVLFAPAARMVRVGRRPRSGPGTALFARPAGWRKAPQAVHPR